MTINNLKIKPLSKSNFAPYGQVIELKNAEKFLARATGSIASTRKLTQTSLWPKNLIKSHFWGIFGQKNL